jgi:hypothetical protein
MSDYASASHSSGKVVVRNFARVGTDASKDTSITYDDSRLQHEESARSVEGA